MIFANEVGPQRPSQDFSQPETKFSQKIFKFVNKTQFEVHLQTQVVEVECTAPEKTLIICTQILLFLLPNLTIKTDRKA